MKRSSLSYLRSTNSVKVLAKTPENDKKVLIMLIDPEYLSLNISLVQVNFEKQKNTMDIISIIETIKFVKNFLYTMKVKQIIKREYNLY